jgi:hypothetical protein
LAVAPPGCNGHFFAKPARLTGRFTCGPAQLVEQSVAETVGESMDKQTKREIWLLAIGTALVELPVAFAAFAILSH